MLFRSRIRHSTLRYVDETTNEAMEKVSEDEQEFEKEFNQELAVARQAAISDIGPAQESVKDLEKKQADGENIDADVLEAKKQLLEQQLQQQQAKLTRKVEQLNNELQEKKRSIRLEAEIKVQEIQRSFKLAAVTLPVIPPLLLGLLVFTRRRLREREGISKARRLK